MKTTWSETPSGVIDVRIQTGALPRLFGLPFLAVGAYFAYRSVMVFADASRGLSEGDVFDLSLTLVFMLVLTAGFVGAGTFLTCATLRTRIDIPNHRVTSRKGIPGISRREVVDVGAHARVGIVHLPERVGDAGSGEHNPVPGYAVLLEQVGQVSTTLAWFDDESGERARELAVLISQRLGLPRSDRTPRRDVRSSGPTRIAAPPPSARSGSDIETVGG